MTSPVSCPMRLRKSQKPFSIAKLSQRVARPSRKPSFAWSRKPRVSSIHCLSLTHSSVTDPDILTPSVIKSNGTT